VEISFPKKITGKLPLIITQHGSTRDGKKIQDGATDEYSKRIIKEGTKQGFAVAALDAFYKKPITSTEKTRFPDALNYANELRKILIKDERFDKEKFFYTGFSYGAQQVLKTIGAPYNNKDPNAWKAIASAEPGCNLFHKPIKLSFPVLIIKGEESHYYIEPCKILEKELLKAGNKVKLVNISKVNHFFSTKGKIVKGVAVNGCRYDPIIKMPDGKSFLYSGAEISRKEARKRCFTNEAGKGKNRKKLNEAVNLTINFFKDNMN
jgi:dienelactone hydrolase